MKYKEKHAVKKAAVWPGNGSQLIAMQESELASWLGDKRAVYISIFRSWMRKARAFQD
jgi:hypothetical protein